MTKKLVLALVAASAAFGQAAKTPDFSGFWEPFRGGGDPKLTPPPASPVVLKEKYAKAYADRQKLEQESLAKGEQLATSGPQCQPYGMPNMMTVASYPMELLQTPTKLAVITEVLHEVRSIYLDRPQMPWDDVAPTYTGRSVGKWQGDTLVIDTVAIKTNTAGYRGIPHSPQMHITERMRLVTPDVLHDQITIEDPETLEKPITYTLGFRRMEKDYEMVEFVCENNREYIDEKGVVRMRVKGK